MSAVSAADVLAALSLATDLGTDQPLEHGLRTSVLCSRLATAAGRDDGDAYHLGLLHSIGCTSDAHEAAAPRSSRRRGPWAAARPCLPEGEDRPPDRRVSLEP